MRSGAATCQGLECEAGVETPGPLDLKSSCDRHEEQETEGMSEGHPLSGSERAIVSRESILNREEDIVIRSRML